MPGLVFTIESVNWRIIDRIGELHFFPQKSARTMAKEFMESNNDKQWRFVVFKMKLKFFKRSVLDRFDSWFSVSIAKVNIFEAKVFSNVIIVWNINTNWDPRTSESKDFETGEVRFLKNFNLEVASPRQMLE